MITTEKRGRSFLIGLNRAAKRNAFDPPMFHALARALGEFDRDPDLWCALVFAHGDHFTAGIDLAQFAPLFERDARFAMLEVSRGLYPLGGATFRLVREGGWGGAMRYLLTGEEWDAGAALRLGLVQEVV